jgi:hypothetical protein
VGFVFTHCLARRSVRAVHTEVSDDVDSLHRGIHAMATVQRTKAPATTTTGRTNGGNATATAAQLTPGAIAQRAYEIWKESGCPAGKDQEHWFRAERELRAKTSYRP